MNTRSPYSYSILRYVHDVATGEFVNIGVAVHCPQASFFEVSCRSTLGRINDFFPDLKAKHFRNFTKLLSSRFAAISDAYSSPLDLEDKSQTLESLLVSVLPKDDSSLRWSPIETGLTYDPRKKLTDLYARYVSKYDNISSTHKRSDDEVRRHFSRALENRNLSGFFKEKTIQGQDDAVKFKSAWKNGIWHCFEPISFDLSAPETIRDKAHRYLGQMVSVSDAGEDFKVYLILAKPTEMDLEPAFDQAVQILKKMKVKNEIFTENQTDSLLERIQLQIRAHDIESETERH